MTLPSRTTTLDRAGSALHTETSSAVEEFEIAGDFPECPGESAIAVYSSRTATDSMERILAWMFYLNDIELGGETEFLHQRLRIKPEKGKCVLFPASFTHCHRGNPPLAATKYIVTGWFKLSHE